MNPEQWEHLLERAERVIARYERLLPEPPTPVEWETATALRWQSLNGRGHLQATAHASVLKLADLRCIDAQKAVLERNTRQFVAKLPANNALLWGARGTGKSSLVKALLSEFAASGLRLVQVETHDLAAVHDIIAALSGRTERFILFCDDLSFDANETGYKRLKAALDGWVGAAPDNVLVYATSNRRHLLAEAMEDNRHVRHIDGELHPGDAIEEKISLSERFGVQLSFYPYTQDQYLEIVAACLKRLHVSVGDPAALRSAALQWALAHGSRSGRVAWQFACDYAGQQGLAI